MTERYEDDPALAPIRKRDQKWLAGFNTGYDDHLREHPETECSADRDRHNLLLGYLNLVGRAEATAAAEQRLDVERLARALVDEIPAVHRWLTVGWKETMDDEARVLAAKLAATYLLPTQASDSPEKP